MKSDWISSLQKTSRGFTLFDVHLVEPLYNVLYVHLVKKKFKVLLKNVTTNQTEQYNSSGTVVSISSSLFLFFCSVSFSHSFSFFPLSQSSLLEDRGLSLMSLLQCWRSKPICLTVVRVSRYQEIGQIERWKCPRARSVRSLLGSPRFSGACLNECRCLWRSLT